MYTILKFTRKQAANWDTYGSVAATYNRGSAAYTELARLQAIETNAGRQSIYYRIKHEPSAAQAAYRLALTDCERALHAIQTGDNYAPHTEERYAELADQLRDAATRLSVAGSARLAELENAK